MLRVRTFAVGELWSTDGVLGVMLDLDPSSKYAYLDKGQWVVNTLPHRCKVPMEVYPGLVDLPNCPEGMENHHIEVFVSGGTACGLVGFWLTPV